jgi:hypothetical protein
MPFARSVRTSWLLLAFGLAGLGGGCGTGTRPPIDQAESDRIRDDMKTSHLQRREDAKKAQAAARKPGGMMKAAHRQGTGR